MTVIVDAKNDGYDRSAHPDPPPQWSAEDHTTGPSRALDAVGDRPSAQSLGRLHAPGLGGRRIVARDKGIAGIAVPLHPLAVAAHRPWAGQPSLSSIRWRPIRPITTNEDLAGSLRRIAGHLAPDGLFAFDIDLEGHLRAGRIFRFSY